MADHRLWSPGGHPIEFEGRRPAVAIDAFVAPDAVLVGAVDLAAGSSVWYTAVLRADMDAITVGADSNVQDGCVLHTDTGVPIVIGRRVSIGHRAVVHGCVIEDDVLVGMGSVVMNRAHVGRGSIVAAGAVVLEGTDVPPNSLVAGVPAKVRRATTADEVETIRRNAATYVALARRHADAVPH